MGQEIRGVPEAAALSGATAAGEASAVGLFLERQRRLRGISLDELSARTKIPLRSLERLEAGAFDRAPDGFTRGFVRTVAAALGLDPDDAVMRLLAEPPDDDVAGSAGAGRLRRSLALGAALLLGVAALGGALWGVRQLLRGQAEDAAGAAILYHRDAVRALAEAEARDPDYAELP